MNIIKTFLFLGFLSVLMIFFGKMFGGNTGMFVMLIISLVMNLGSYWFSDKLVLKITKAKPVKREDIPVIFEIVDELSKNAKISMPKIYMTEDLHPNAFATGRNPKNAVVAITRGLLELVDKSELKGVLAHEIAHIKNRDILISSIAAMMAGVISYGAHMVQWAAIFGSGSDEGEGNSSGNLIMAILAPIMAIIVQMAISRSREYHADATGAKIANDTEGLSNALRKLELAGERIPLENANPATSHMYISSPLRGGGLLGLFSTHPPVQNRIKKLNELNINS